MTQQSTSPADTTKRRFRSHNWIDTRTMQPMFGIQGRHSEGGWAHVARDGKPLLFDTEQARNDALRELRR